MNGAQGCPTPPAALAEPAPAGGDVQRRERRAEGRLRSLAVPPGPPPAPAGRRVLPVDVEVVTPMMGGGSCPRECDEDVPVRASAVRGQLRFWWRATRGCEFEEPGELLHRERAVWGGVGDEGPQASEVLLRVEAVQRGQRIAAGIHRWNPKLAQGRGGHKSLPEWRNGYPGYALFPLQRTRENLDAAPRGADEPTADVVAGLGFRLVVSYKPELEADVRAALWAWIAFGGLGARTRRGLGALASPTPGMGCPRGADLGAWLRERWAEHVWHRPVDRPWPVLDGARAILLPSEGNALMAWSRAVELLRAFRQEEGFARDPGREGRPGRSRWPEADSLRLNVVGKQRPWAHPPRLPSGVAPFFPRAAFGLPIVFQFKDAGDREAGGTLQPSGVGGRLASPLLLRPVRDGGGRFQPLVLQLRAPGPWDLGALEVVRDGGSVHVRVAAGDTLRGSRPTWAQSPLGGEGNALTAFRSFVQSRHPHAQVVP